MLMAVEYNEANAPIQKAQMSVRNGKTAGMNKNITIQMKR